MIKFGQCLQVMTRESLMVSYGPEVMNFVRDKGWRFTGRAHIMAFNTERRV